MDQREQYFHEFFVEAKDIISDFRERCKLTILQDFDDLDKKWEDAEKRLAEKLGMSVADVKDLLKESCPKKSSP